MEKKINPATNLGRIVWLYTKYQMITKGLLALVVFPAASAVLSFLLASRGRTHISSGDYLEFLLSFQGAGMLALALLLLILLIGMDVNAFIIMSALVREGRIKMTARHLLIVGLRSLRSFLSPSGILIMLYMALVIPLVGVGFTISPMKGFQIPNFITDVIFKNTLYSSLYFVLLLTLTYVSLRYIFFFHYALILRESMGESLRRASELMHRHWKSFARDFVLWMILWSFVAGALLIGSILLFILPANLLPETIFGQRLWTILGLMVLAELIAFVTLMSVPIICYRLTELFYRYNEEEGTAVKLGIEVRAQVPAEEKGGKIRLRTKAAFGLLASLLMVFNFIVAAFSGAFFDELFRREREIVAHRGGGDLAAENTAASLEAAIREGVAWSEIGVQRTGDGKYVINHDPNFARLTGDPRTSSEMTLAEIKKLRVADLFDPSRPLQEVATMEELLETARGRIGLFIELKGATADEKMADDIVAMVKAYRMEKEIALLSLDYSLIEYIEEKYPEIRTGFLYFFSLGETAEMKGDILIMEEREATPEKIDEIHAAGKKAIVWTVNTEESIDKFVSSEVDGIITDYVLRVKAGMERRDSRTDFEILLDNFLQ